MLRSSQKDNLLSIQTLRQKCLGVFLCSTLRVLVACASAALAKNSPPDCFLHARTVLQEIIILSIQTLRWKHLGVFLCPTLRVIAACASAALAKNSPPDCFLHARTVLQAIIILSIQTLRQKCLGVFFLHCTAPLNYIHHIIRRQNSLRGDFTI